MDFEAQLKAICHTPSGPYLRPFRPNPEWTTAKAFIVGSNPATPMRAEFVSFDQYWEALTRRPDVFDKAYSTVRSGEDSKTTTRVNDLCQHLQGVNYLVTNAAAYPAAHNERVPASQWKIGRQIFDLLFSLCRPKAIFVHGGHARKLIEGRFDVQLDPFCSPETQMQRVDGCLILSAPHLSGAGMPKGATFSVETALPAFARRIREAAN